MADIVLQASFNSGEWSPQLYSRVDVAKYKSGAALMSNWYVDYRGGASTRMGLKWMNQAFSYNNTVRMVRFQLSSTVGFALEFGNNYIRFYFQGAPVLEPGIAISGAAQTNPLQVTATSSGFFAGQTIFISGVAGMTQINNRYFQVLSNNGATGVLTLGDLLGNPINATGYSPYTAGGTVQRVFTILSPYASSELAQLKFSQNGDALTICHPNHPPYVLSEVSPTNWNLSVIPLGLVTVGPSITSNNTNLAAGSVNYAYCVTYIDANGNESAAGPIYNIGSLQDMRVNNGTIQLNWSAVPGAQAYNIYKALVSYTGVVPSGVQFGYIGQCTGTSFVDQNIAASFLLTPPLSRNPITGGTGIASITMTSVGNYTSVPTVTAVPSPGTEPAIPASLTAILQVNTGTVTIATPGTGYAGNDVVSFFNGVVAVVTGIGAGGSVTSLSFAPPGAQGNLTAGAVPPNPLPQFATTGGGTGLTINVGQWGVGAVNINDPGVNYSATPTILFSPASATATATLGASGSYPTVPFFFQQRAGYAAPVNAPLSFFMSQTGLYNNFNIHNPIIASDAITGTLISGQLQSIKSIVTTTAGMMILTDSAAWIVNGGVTSSAVSPSTLNANPQSYVGANDVPPIVANYDILYVQEKGAAVRDIAYNIYFNVFTGTEISILANHLFYGHQLLEWAWAEEPFKTVWAVRNDGIMLSLGFLKEQDIIGWAQHSTTGLVKSVCTVTELSNGVYVDAVYLAVQRTVNGVSAIQIERMADRVFPTIADCICVDSAAQYIGSPAMTFYGAEHLGGLTCTGLADGQQIPAFVMPANGQFTLATPASKVTVGVGYNCDLQTLPIDIGSPSIQGKLKSIPYVDLLVYQSLGLSIGGDSSTLVAMKDLINGNVSSGLTGLSLPQVVSGFYTGHARTFLNPSFNVPGQYLIRQALPYPATVVGVFPALEVEK